MAFVLAAAVRSAAPQAPDQGKPYGRACLALAEPEGDKLLEETAQAGEGKSFVVYLDANRPCLAFIAAFTRKEGRLANDWQPLLVELPEWEAQRLPSKPQVWEWTKEGEPFDVQVFFLARDTPGLDKLRALVKAMSGDGREAALAKLQERQLREVLAPWVADESAVAARPANAPARIGGTARAAGAEFPWRDYARSVNFSAEKPGVITFRHDAP